MPLPTLRRCSSAIRPTRAQTAAIAALRQSESRIKAAVEDPDNELHSSAVDLHASASRQHQAVHAPAHGSRHRQLCWSGSQSTDHPGAVCVFRGPRRGAESDTRLPRRVDWCRIATQWAKSRRTASYPFQQTHQPAHIPSAVTWLVRPARTVSSRVLRSCAV